jgi:hypothetical protein
MKQARGKNHTFNILLQISNYFKRIIGKKQIISHNFFKSEKKRGNIPLFSLTFFRAYAKITSINRGADEQEYHSPTMKHGQVFGRIGKGYLRRSANPVPLRWAYGIISV